MLENYEFDQDNYNNDNNFNGDQNNGNRNGNRKKTPKVVKRAGAIILSAVLFGGAAGFTFNSIINTGTSQTSETENSISSDKVNLVQASTTASSTETSSDGDMTVTEIAEAVMPSVVSITNISVEEVQEYYGMFGGNGYVTEEEIESSGSGIIIGQNDTELLILTNNHVVENAETLTVGFNDESAVEAKIKGTDADSDLAVIAVSLEDISDDTMSAIKIATLGSSDNLKVGEQVVAIGNALGYGQSVTTGVASALNRQIDDSEESMGLIQTDAAINPGNSGGALINMRGEVIGINSSKFASTEVEGMGYAIPIDTATPIIEELMNQETREKVDDSQASSIGISGADVSSEMQEVYGMPAGVYVSEVSEGGAAQNAGIQSGNIITKFDGTSITSIDGLKNLLQYYAAGETVEVTIKVANNNEYEEQTVTVTLDQASTSDSSSSESQSQSQSQEEDWSQYFNQGQGQGYGY